MKETLLKVTSFVINGAVIAAGAIYCVYGAYLHAVRIF